MGNLTDDMTRLRGEVDALRSDRGALLQELRRGARELAYMVSAMRADFAAAHTAMAKQTRGAREAFVASMTCEVNYLLGVFSRDRDTMARKRRYDRGGFLAEMRRQVTSMRKEAADDLLGARLAWRGQIHGKPRPVQQKKAPESETPTLLVKEPRGEQEQKSALKTPMTAMNKMPVEAMVAETAPATPVGVPPKVKAHEPVVNSIMFQKSKEKKMPDKTPAKTTAKGKRAGHK